MSFSIVDKDNGYTLRVRNIKTARSSYVKIGVPDTPHEPDGTAMDVIGAAHEFGDAHVPQRSYLRAWAEENAGPAQDKMQAAFEKHEDDPQSALEEFAQWAIAGIKQRIRDNIAPELSEQTIKRKGHDIALIDTEQLINSIMAETVIRGKSEHVESLEAEPPHEESEAGEAFESAEGAVE